MFPVDVTPLIHKPKSDGVKLFWFADDATAEGKLCQITPVPAKTWLVKEGTLDATTRNIEGSSVTIAMML